MKNALALPIFIGMVLSNYCDLEAAQKRSKSAGDQRELSGPRRPGVTRRESCAAPNPNGLRMQAAEFSEAVEAHKQKLSKTRKNLWEREMLSIFSSMMRNLAVISNNAGKQREIEELLADCNRATCEEFDVVRLSALVNRIKEFEPDTIRQIESRGALDEEGDLSPSHPARQQRSSIDLHEQAVQARREFERVAQDIFLFDGRASNSLTDDDLKRLAELQDAVDGIVESILSDPALGDHARNDLWEEIQRVKDTLAMQRQASCTSPDGRLINPTAQVTAQTAVYVVIALVKIATILGAKAETLRVATDPALVAQRNSYRKWAFFCAGIVLVGTVTLTALNAFGVILLEVPPLTDVFAALTNAL